MYVAIYAIREIGFIRRRRKPTLALYIAMTQFLIFWGHLLFLLDILNLLRVTISF